MFGQVLDLTEVFARLKPVVFDNVTNRLNAAVRAAHADGLAL